MGWTSRKYATPRHVSDDHEVVIATSPRGPAELAEEGLRIQQFEEAALASDLSPTSPHGPAAARRRTHFEGKRVSKHGGSSKTKLECTNTRNKDSHSTLVAGVFADHKFNQTLNKE